MHFDVLCEIESSLLRRWDYRVVQTLLSFRGKKITYVPFPGNAGDSLVASATFQMFRTLKLDVLEVRDDLPNDAQVVIIGGGGNFVPLYGDVKELLEKALLLNAQTVILPQTIRGHDELLQKLDHRFTIFCREADSYSHVIKNNIRSDIQIADDLAFGLDVNGILLDSSIIDAAKDLWRERLLAAGISQKLLLKRKKWYFLRKDIEALDPLVRSDLDLSDVMAFGTWAGNAELSAWAFLNTLRMCKYVVTDRLHVAIGCAILGTPCELRDNSYGKNRSVFEKSFRQRFPHVTFVSAT